MTNTTSKMNRPAKKFETHKSTRSAKLETLRRREIRRDKYSTN